MVKFSLTFSLCRTFSSSPFKSFYLYSVNPFVGKLNSPSIVQRIYRERMAILQI